MEVPLILKIQEFSFMHILSQVLGLLINLFICQNCRKTGASRNTLKGPCLSQESAKMSAFLREIQSPHTSEQTRWNTESHASFVLERLEMDLISRDTLLPQTLGVSLCSTVSPMVPGNWGRKRIHCGALASREVDGVRQEICCKSTPRPQRDWGLAASSFSFKSVICTLRLHCPWESFRPS